LQSSGYKVLINAIKNPPKTSKFDIGALATDLLSALLIPQTSNTNASSPSGQAFAVLKTLLLDRDSPQNRATACLLVQKAVSWKRDEPVLNFVEALIKSKMFHMLQGFAVLDCESIVSEGARKALEDLLKRLPVGNQILVKIEGMTIPFKPSELEKAAKVEKDVKNEPPPPPPPPVRANAITPDFPIYNKPIVTFGGLVDAAEEDEVDYIDDTVSGLHNGRMNGLHLGRYHITQAILLVGDIQIKFSQALCCVLDPPNQNETLGRKHPSSRIIATSAQSATELISNDPEIISKIWPLRNRLAGVILGVKYDNVIKCLAGAAATSSSRLLGLHRSTPLRSFFHPIQPCIHRVLLPFPSAGDLRNMDMLTSFFQSLRPLLRKEAEVHVSVGVSPTELTVPPIPTKFPSIGTEDLADRTQILNKAARTAGYRPLSRFPFIPCPGYDLSKVLYASFEPMTYVFLPE